MTYVELLRKKADALDAQAAWLRAKADYHTRAQTLPPINAAIRAVREHIASEVEAIASFPASPRTSRVKPETAPSAHIDPEIEAKASSLLDRLGSADEKADEVKAEPRGGRPLVQRSVAPGPSAPKPLGESRMGESRPRYAGSDPAPVNETRLPASEGPGHGLAPLDKARERPTAKDAPPDEKPAIRTRRGLEVVYADDGQVYAKSIREAASLFDRSVPWIRAHAAKGTLASNGRKLVIRGAE